MSDLTTLANIGPAMARDLNRLGITAAAQLAGRDAVELYERLGFRILGTVPRAFAHPELGRVGLHLMYLEF